MIGALNLLQAAGQIAGMIGMMLPAQPHEGVAYRAVRRISRYTQHLIMVRPRCPFLRAALHSHAATHHKPTVSIRADLRGRP